VGKAEEAKEAPSAPKCTEVGPVTASQEESRAKEEEISAEPIPPPPQSKRALKPVTKPKKVISRRKAGKQARTINVTSPKE
jgi:hypothetical protein